MASLPDTWLTDQFSSPKTNPPPYDGFSSPKTNPPYDGFSNPLYNGATVRELSRLFRMQPSTIRDRLATVRSNGTRRNAETYDIAVVAPYLTEATESEAEHVSRILRMHHTDLPKTLSREYWAGQIAKQKYEITAGDLWPTAKIVQWLADAFKAIRLSLMLMADTVERNDALTETQRRIIIDLIDATLNDAAARLIRGFEDKRKSEIGGSSPSKEDGGDEEL